MDLPDPCVHFLDPCVQHGSAAYAAPFMGLPDVCFLNFVFSQYRDVLEYTRTIHMVTLPVIEPGTRRIKLKRGTKCTEKDNI